MINIIQRIVIFDIYRKKTNHDLRGNNVKEQYDYYEKKYLNNATYIKSLLQEYPELKRLLELKNNSPREQNVKSGNLFMQKKNRYKKYSVMEESFPGLWEFTCRKAIHTEEDEVWRR